jgi:Amt family ammonium transporter
LTANEDHSAPPWISGEFDITSLLRNAPRLLTKEQFVDHLDRQIEITRKSLDWRFAVLLVNIESLESIEALRGKSVAEEFLRSAAERAGRRLHPRDAVALMRDRCFAVLVEVPLIHMSMEQLAAVIQQDIVSLIVEQNARIDPSTSVGIAKVGRNYTTATDVIRDAGIALNRAREAGAGTVMAFNRSMEMIDAAIST